jgi:hypothetical protein
MKFLFTILFVGFWCSSFAQKIDSIFFNLYTDSLKKGSWNYINVDAKLSNGKYIPLNEKQLIINTSAGKQEGNSIWLDWDFKPEFITVEIQLKENKSITQKKTIWVKKQDLQMNAPVKDSLLQQINNRNKKQSSPRKKKTN